MYIFFHIFRHFDYLLPVNKTLAFFFNSIQSSFIYFIWLLYLQHRKDVTVTFQFNEVSTQGYIDQKPMHGNCMNYRFVDGDEEAILTCKELKELVFCEFYGFIYNIHTFRTFCRRTKSNFFGKWIKYVESWLRHFNSQLIGYTWKMCTSYFWQIFYSYLEIRGPKPFL